MEQIKINQTLPDFECTPAFGKETHFYGRTKSTYTVLLFLRFMGCRFTQYDIQQYEKHMAQFQQAGAQVWAVIQSSPERIRDHYAAATPHIVLLGDPQCQLYHTFGIQPALSEEEFKGVLFQKKIALVEQAGLVGGEKEGEPWQKPAAIVVNQDNQVVYTYYGTEGADTPSPDMVLAALA